MDICKNIYMYIYIYDIMHLDMWNLNKYQEHTNRESDGGCQGLRSREMGRYG